MPQLSLYMDEPMMEGLRQDAAREGKTLSKFVAGVLRDRDTNGLWPHGSSTCTASAMTTRSSNRRRFPGNSTRLEKRCR